MKISDLWVMENPQALGVGEDGEFGIDFSALGTPALVNWVKAYDAAGQDVSGTVLSGTAILTGAVLTTKMLTPTSAQTYRLVASVEIEGQTKYGLVDVVAAAVIPAQAANGYCTLDELKQALFPTGEGDVNDDARLISVITAVSRLIDEETSRRYWTTADDETRYFTAEDPYELRPGEDIVSVTTIQTDEDGDRVYERTWSATDYDLTPYNAALDGRPYTKICTAPVGRYEFPAGVRRGVKLTGKFGWSACPALAKEACLLQSLRLFKRKDAVFEQAAAVDMGNAIPIRALDPDVAKMLAPLRKFQIF